MPRRLTIGILLAILVLATIIGVTSGLADYNDPKIANGASCSYLAHYDAMPAIIDSCRTSSYVVGIRNGAIAALVGGLVVLILARRKTT